MCGDLEQALVRITDDYLALAEEQTWVVKNGLSERAADFHEAIGIAKSKRAVVIRELLRNQESHRPGCRWFVLPFRRDEPS
jgi:hypothetical protein